jgi:iron complex transport system substrate-binding protein
VADLGLQQEVNLELLASLRPDLILTSPFVQNVEPALRRIAETMRLSIFEKTAAPLDWPRALARTLGQRLDRVEEASRFLANAEQLFDGYRAQIAALTPSPVLLVSFVDARHVRVYGGSGLFQNVLDRIGVTNAWNGKSNYWGFATVGIEELATDRDLRLITFEPIPADARRTLQRSPLWFRLPFVEAGHVSVLPPVLMFGAMPSALRFARLLVGRLERLAA